MERLEASIAALDGQMVMVKVPLFGTVLTAWFGTLINQMNDMDEPQFLIYRQGSPTLVFQIKDVMSVQIPNEPVVTDNPAVMPVPTQIYLKNTTNVS